MQWFDARAGLAGFREQSIGRCCRASLCNGRAAGIEDTSIGDQRRHRGCDSPPRLAKAGTKRRGMMVPSISRLIQPSFWSLPAVYTIMIATDPFPRLARILWCASCLRTQHTRLATPSPPLSLCTAFFEPDRRGPSLPSRARPYTASPPTPLPYQHRLLLALCVSVLHILTPLIIHR